MTKARQDNPYERDLDRNPANHTALTPLSFLERAATIYPERTAIIHGDIRRTWAETSARCRRLASALSARGVGVGSTVAMMAPRSRSSRASWPSGGSRYTWRTSAR